MMHYICHVVYNYSADHNISSYNNICTYVYTLCLFAGFPMQDALHSVHVTALLLTPLATIHNMFVSTRFLDMMSTLTLVLERRVEKGRENEPSHLFSLLW